MIFRTLAHSKCVGDHVLGNIPEIVKYVCFPKFAKCGFPKLQTSLQASKMRQFETRANPLYKPSKYLRNHNLCKNNKNIERPVVYISSNINPPLAHWNPTTQGSHPGNKDRFAKRKERGGGVGAFLKILFIA